MGLLPMRRKIFLFISLAVALVLFVIFLAGNQSPRSIGILPIIIFAAVMLLVGGFFLYTQHNRDDADAFLMSFQPMPRNRWSKVIFASLGVSLAVSIVMLVLAFFFLEYDIVVGYVKENFLKHILVVQLLCIPIVRKTLKP